MSTTDSITHEIQLLEPPVPVYVPTPKHILAKARKENGSTAIAAAPIALTEPVKKRPKLEYVPRSKHPVDIASTALKYVPWKFPSPSDEYVPSTDLKETDDLTGIENELISTNETTQSNDEKVGMSEAAAPIDVEKSIESNGSAKRSGSKEKSSSRHGSSSKSSHSTHHSDRHKHSSSSSKSSHRSSSSSHKKSSSSSHSSSSTSRGKSKYSDKEKDKDKDKDRSSSKESKEKNGDKKPTSSSSSSHRRSSSHKSTRHRSSSSEHKSKSDSASKNETINTDALMYETDLEEDDVEAQCRMIFEEFDPETVTPSTDSESAAHPNKDESYDPMAKYDDCGKRKRVAYENADSQHKPMKPFSQSTNHVQNALQSVFRRQEIVRKQMEEKQQKEQEEEAKRQAQLEAKRKLIEQKQNAKVPNASNSTTKLTPLVSPPPLANQRYYSKFSAPISNVLAIQKAKEKVEQLRAAKMQQQPQFAQTIAHTVAKGAARVAHTTTAATSATVATSAQVNLRPLPQEMQNSKEKAIFTFFYRFLHRSLLRQCWNHHPPKFRTIFGCNITI